MRAWAQITGLWLQTFKGGGVHRGRDPESAGSPPGGRAACRGWKVGSIATPHQRNHPPSCWACVEPGARVGFKELGRCPAKFLGRCAGCTLGADGLLKRTHISFLCGNYNNMETFSFFLSFFEEHIPGPRPGIQREVQESPCLPLPPFPER